MSYTCREKLFLISIAIAFFLFLSSLYNLCINLQDNEKLKMTLTQEMVAVYAASNSFTKYEQIVQNITYFLEKTYINKNFSTDRTSLAIYLKETDEAIKNILILDNSVDGAWLSINPDLFIRITSSKLSFKNFSFTTWYYRDSKNNIIKDTPTNNVISPEADPYYFEAVNAKSLIMTSMYEDSDIKKEMISIAAPIYVKEMLLGVAGIDISKNYLEEILESLKIKYPFLNVYFFNADGTLALSSSKKPSKDLVNYIKKLSSKTDLEDNLNTIIGGNLVIVDRKDIDGPFLVSILPLNNTIDNIEIISYAMIATSIILLIITIVLFQISRSKRDPKLE